MSGDTTLFARIDEVMASWDLFTPVLKTWEETEVTDFPNYEAGSWGPAQSDQLLDVDGKHWRTL